MAYEQTHIYLGSIISNIQQRTWGPWLFGPLDKKVASHLTVQGTFLGVNFWVIQDRIEKLARYLPWKSTTTIKKMVVPIGWE